MLSRLLLTTLVFLDMALVAAGTDDKPERTPTEFEIQILEPTGGKIAKPKGWHYAQEQRGLVYMWTLSREKAVGQHYTTGVRIQAILAVKENTGMTAKEFIMDFVAKKKKEADQVVKSCDAADQGMFMRTCLEIKQGPHHILYSLFWGTKGVDLAVITIAGTTHELWDVYSPVFDKMSTFELVDADRFKK